MADELDCVKQPVKKALEALEWRIHSSEGEDIWRGEGQSDYTYRLKASREHLTRAFECLQMLAS